MARTDVWLDLCPQTIVWEPMTGRDQYGKPTYGAAQTFRGRRVLKQGRVASRAPNGEAITTLTSSTIWILGLPAVKPLEDHVYVQGDTPPYPVVVSTDRYPDEIGDLFVKVYLGAA